MLRLIKTCMKRNRHLIRFTSMVAVLFPTALLSAGCGTKEQEEAIVQKSESVLSASSVVSEDSPVVEDLVSTSVLTISNYVEIEFDGAGFEEMGAGTFDLENASGSTADGDEIKVFATKDLILDQISYVSEEMDGSHLTYIYVDGMLNTKRQIGTGSGTFDLKDSFLAEGEHKVEAVQYDNDQADGRVITYKRKNYTVIPA